MKKNEILSIFLALVILAITLELFNVLNQNFDVFAITFLFSAVVLGSNILTKKVVASKLDIDVEHKTWEMYHYGFKPSEHFKKPILAGVIFPLVFSAVSIGRISLGTLLTYDTQTLKRRKARRFGSLSYTEITDFHNALIGAAGIFAVLVIAFLGYWIQPLSGLSKIAIIYAFSNMIPFSKLDGAQIYYGSPVLWFSLAIVTLIFMGYALFLI